jgi:hypothetical protein
VLHFLGEVKAMADDVGNRLARKLNLLATPGISAMKEFAGHVRDLMNAGQTADQAAIKAASSKFAAEFRAQRYNYQGEAIETILADIEKL